MMVLHIQLGTVTAVNADYWTDPVANPAEGRELLAYVENLGQALIQDVQFTVNGNPLDEYTSEVYNFHNKLNTIDLVYTKMYASFFYTLLIKKEYRKSDTVKLRENPYILTTTIDLETDQYTYRKTYKHGKNVKIWTIRSQVCIIVYIKQQNTNAVQRLNVGGLGVLL
jgi:hypothetical protein